MIGDFFLIFGIFLIWFAVALWVGSAFGHLFRRQEKLAPPPQSLSDWELFHEAAESRRERAEARHEEYGGAA